MEAKFTIRDILVYFLTGSALILTLGLIYWDLIVENYTEVLQITPEGKIISTIIILPIIYLLGHTVDSLDILRVNIANKIRPKSTNKKIWKKLKEWIYFFLAGDRISGALYFREKKSNPNFQEDFKQFWQKVNFIQVNEKYGLSEYLEVMKDLFNSLQSVLLVGIGLSIVELKWKLIIVFSILLFLFWIKAEHYSKSYINSVENIFDSLEKQNKEKKPSANKA